MGGTASAVGWGIGSVAVLLFGVAHPAVCEPPAASRFSLGSAVIEIGGQLRFRFEDDQGFDIKGYRPGERDRFVLSRVVLDTTARLAPRHLVQLTWSW